MSDIEDLHAHATYVVRVSRDDSGRIRGVVVQVATGRRWPFADAGGAGPVLRELIAANLGTPARSGTETAQDARPGGPDAATRSNEEET